MKVANRKTVRNALKASMDATLVGPTKVAQGVYEYQTGEFDMVLPDNDVANVSVFVITSDGSERQFDDILIAPEQLVYLNVHSFVLYEKEAEWTEKQSEDQIDDMEAGFLEWLDPLVDRRGEASPPWLECHLIGRSKIDSIFLGGIEYRHEAFALEFLVANTE